jgi:nitric oxide synthase oxygenase domain/subunit
MDAANVDLKAFTDDFYFKLCGAHLQPVLDTWPTSTTRRGCWLEITTLLIPGATTATTNSSRCRLGGARNSAPTCRCISPPSTPTQSTCWGS